jgi:hypothetical protein
VRCRWYEGTDVSALIDTGLVNVRDNTIITVNYDTTISDTALSGIAGGIRHATLAKRLLDESWSSPGSQDTTRKALLTVASTGESLGYLAGSDRNAMMSIFTSFSSSYSAAIDEVRTDSKIDPARQARALNILLNGMN